jgi:hypothetical protein
LISIGKFETNLQICGKSQMPYQKMIFLIHVHLDLKISHFDSKNCLPDVDSAFVRHIMYQSKPERTIIDRVEVKYRTNDILHGLVRFG